MKDCTIPGGHPNRWKVLLIIVLTVLSYTSALKGGYIWDDDDYLTENNALRSAHGLVRIWTQPAASPQYYPLVFTSFWFERRIWGPNPFGYHLANVILHSGVACLVYYLLLLLEVPGAFFAALIFAVHPVEVETVAWISERKNLLSGVFYLLSAIAFLKFYRLGRYQESKEGLGEEKQKQKNPPQRRRDAEKSSLTWKNKKPDSLVSAPSPCPVHDQPLRWNWSVYWLGLLFFGCALLSKTVACTLPVTLLVVLWWKRGRVTRSEALSLAPLFALGAGMGLLTVWLERTHVGASGADWGLGIVERFLVAGRALCFYASKIVWPANLSFNYERWTVDAGIWWQYLYPLAATAVFAALWIGRKRFGRGPAAAAIFFTATLFPALGFFNVFPFRYSFVADHFQYLAGIGPITLLVAGAARYAAELRPGTLKLLFKAAAVAAIALLIAITWRQGNIYADSQTLYQDVLRKNPKSILAHNNLGNLLVKQGKHDEALAHYMEALKVRADFDISRFNLAMTYYNMGVAEADMGKTEEAKTHYEEAIRARPNSEKPYNNLGRLLALEGKVQDAVHCWIKAVEIKPDYAGAHYNLLLGYVQLGDYASASREYSTLTDIDPALAEKARPIIAGYH